jgi:hypothetical protein
MPEGRFRIPDRSYEQLRGVAERFLAEHHSNAAIPVPVEEIMEFRLGLNIIPVPGLRRYFDIDGYISKSLCDISVDQYIQETRPDYYRYTLAHELAHVLIHGDVVEQFEFATIEEWKALILGVDADESAVYDGQAHDLGTLILVPPDPLAEEFEEDRRRVQQRGMTLARVIATENGRRILESDLARRFNVPRFVITDRMNRDRLWPC